MKQTNNNSERENTQVQNINREELPSLKELRANPKYSHEIASKAVRVSNHTAEWIRIYKTVSKIWGDISDILYTETGVMVDVLMDKHFTPHLSNLLDSIMRKGITESICETMGTCDDETMI